MGKIPLLSVKVGNNRRAINSEQVEALAKSIQEIGLLSPIVLTQDNILVAGQHRLEAFKLLGNAEIPFVYAEKDDSLLLRLAEIDENLIRNNGTQLEQSDWLSERKKIYEQLYPETKQGASGRRGSGENVQFSKNEKSSFSENTAKQIGQTARNVQKKVARSENIPSEIKDMIRDTPIADKGSELDEIVNLVKQSPEKAVPIVQKAIAQDIPLKEAIRETAQKERRDERVERVKQGASGRRGMGETQESYPIIYADPPWRYEHSKTDNRAIENQYPTMDIEEICALPVGALASQDAVLFLWVTSPKLVEGLRVVESWGFTYRSCAVWVKNKIGMGYYFRQRHELLFVATRGNIPTPEPAMRRDSVLQYPRHNHSEKPHEVYEIIEGMYPEYPKIELFSRNVRTGWEGWGFDYGK